MTQSSYFDYSWLLPRRLLADEALKTGVLEGELRVPGAVGPLRVDLLIHSGTARVGTRGRLPEDGRVPTRLKWLVRQLQKADEAPSDLQVSIEWSGRSTESSALLRQLDDSHNPLLRLATGEMIAAPNEPRSFRLERAYRLKKGRGKSTSRILEGIQNDVEDFYRRVVEHLAPWVRPAPRYKEQESSRRQEGPEAGFDQAPAAGDDAEIAAAVPAAGDPQAVLGRRASDDTTLNDDDSFAAPVPADRQLPSGAGPANTDQRLNRADATPGAAARAEEGGTE